MNEWYDNQKKSSNNFRELLQKRIDKANPRRELTAEEAKHLALGHHVALVEAGDYELSEWSQEIY